MGDAGGSSKPKPACGWTYFRHALTRSKPLDQDKIMETPLNRNLNQCDVLVYGLGGMIGNSIYGVVAVVARKYTGPATFISFILAGFAALLNGLCYSELSAHIPRAGSAYSYTYVIAGEFLAFITGWLMLLEYSITASSAAVSVAYNLDIISNGTISRGILQHVGRLAESNDGIINEYPNLIAALVCVIGLAILTTGNTVSSWINIILTSFTMVVIGIATGYMFAFFDSYNLINSRYPFLPFGIAGLFSGSGIAFNAFIGFDAISVAGEEAKNPRKTIPIAITVAVVLVIVICVIHAVAFVGYTPWWEVNAQLGLANVFFHPSVTWLRILVGIGAVVAALCSVVCCTFAIPRVAYSMASDGLLFPWMAWIHPKTKVPLIPLYIFGSVTMVISVFFNYASLVSFLSVGTLISYIFVAFDLLILRFMKPELYVVKHDKEVGYLYQQFRVLTFIDSRSRGLVPCLATGCFVLISATLILFCIEAGKQIAVIQGWAIFVVVTLTCALVLCVVIIALHRPYSSTNGDEDRFEAPLVPFVPLLCIFFNIILIIKLPALTWVRVGVWMAIGFIIYFGYGIWKSQLATTADAISPADAAEYSSVPGNNEEKAPRSRRSSRTDETDNDQKSAKTDTFNERTPIIKKESDSAR